MYPVYDFMIIIIIIIIIDLDKTRKMAIANKTCVSGKKAA